MDRGQRTLLPWTIDTAAGQFMTAVAAMPEEFQDIIVNAEG
jgi:hypothetical protein